MRSGGNTAEATATAKATFSAPATVEQWTWHSPVPYLFSGLAAMLGLIAFALLTLACSYWKPSAGEEAEVETAAAVFEDKRLVIMAGQNEPTFLATPMPTIHTSLDDAKRKEKVLQEEEEKKR